MVLSRVKIQTPCNFCGLSFYKELRLIKENKKLGHNFYCSKNCQTNKQRKGHRLNCENLNCKKKFYRAKNNILEHNYCSQSCAAIINNKKFPKRPAPFKKCANTLCGKLFKKEKTALFCSYSCRVMGKRRYTKEDLIRKIRSSFENLKRVPAKRELKGIAEACVYAFGSWNKAIEAAGFTPNRSHDDRMYKRINTTAQDGHRCDSISEAIIDNWLSAHKIPHARDVAYPSTNHKADWAISDNIFIEYFGLANDSPRYDREIKIKKKLCHENNIRLVEVYARDLYPNNLLENNLEKLNFK